MESQSVSPVETYHHVQRSPLFVILILVAGLMCVLSWTARNQTLAPGILILVAAVFLILAFSFYSLTTIIRNERLIVRFGPIPLFGTHLELVEMDEVVVDSTSIVDGWGIHFILMRGWTYNLWGFSCVKIVMGNRVIRVGTDDAENLAKQLNADCDAAKGNAMTTNSTP